MNRMNRTSKLTARIEALRADEIELRNRYSEALAAQADDDFGDVDRKTIKRLADQLQAIRVEIAGLEDAMDRAVALDEADRAREADIARLGEFEAFQVSFNVRLQATKAFENALHELVESIKQVQAADAEMPVGLRRETPWKHGLVAALAGVIGRDGVLPRPGDAPQPRAFWNRNEVAPCSGFILREHQHRVFNEAVELNRAGLLADIEGRPETVTTFAEPTKPKAANRPTFGGTFVEQGDGYYLRDGDARVFEKTEFGFIVAVGHRGYATRRTMTTREIS